MSHCPGPGFGTPIRAALQGPIWRTRSNQVQAIVPENQRFTDVWQALLTIDAIFRERRSSRTARVRLFDHCKFDTNLGVITVADAIVKSIQPNIRFLGDAL